MLNMNETDILLLIEKGENSTIEFKGTNPKQEVLQEK